MFHRMMCLQLALGLGGSLSCPLLPTSVCLGQSAGESREGTVVIAAPDPHGDSASQGADVLREKAIDQLARKLGRMKRARGTEKSLKDHFVVRTFHMDRKTGKAEIRFQLSSGQRETAAMLVDFSSQASIINVCHWQVLLRVGALDTGQQAVANLQDLFDVSHNYREQLKKAYRAKSIRRC